MCDATLAISSLVSLIGTATQASGQAQAAGAQADALRRNQTLLKLQEADAAQRGREAAGAMRTQGSRTIAKARVAAAASGVDVSVGSPLEALEDTRLMTELDAQRIQNNAAREVWGYKQQGRQLREQEEAVRRNGRGAVFGSLLSGAGQLAMGYGRFSAQSTVNARAAALNDGLGG